MDWTTQSGVHAGTTEWSTGVGVANFVHLPASNFKLFEALNTAGSHAGNSSTICQGLATNYLGMMDAQTSGCLPLEVKLGEPKDARVLSPWQSICQLYIMSEWNGTLGVR